MDWIYSLNIDRSRVGHFCLLAYTRIVFRACAFFAAKQCERATTNKALYTLERAIDIHSHFPLIYILIDQSCHMCDETAVACSHLHRSRWGKEPICGHWFLPLTLCVEESMCKHGQIMRMLAVGARKKLYEWVAMTQIWTMASS